MRGKNFLKLICIIIVIFFIVPNLKVNADIINKNQSKSYGWIKYNNNWYYLSGNGKMKTGWLKEGSSWYYLSGNGKMKTGWLKEGSSWYYLSGNGKMKTGWLKDGSSWYYLNSSGRWEESGLAKDISKTKISKKTKQIILVSGDRLYFFEKNNGIWEQILNEKARHGYAGFKKNKHEGDGATPIGVYSILYGFGFSSNPGTKLNYKKITNNSYFVDNSNSKYYNKWYEGKGERGEHMIDHYQYKYGMVIDYNRNQRKGKGSAIFIHCNGRGNTAGCISIPENSMLRLLKKVNNGAYIIITTNNKNLKDY